MLSLLFTDDLLLIVGIQIDCFNDRTIHLDVVNIYTKTGEEYLRQWPFYSFFLFFSYATLF